MNVTLNGKSGIGMEPKFLFFSQNCSGLKTAKSVRFALGGGEVPLKGPVFSHQTFFISVFGLVCQGGQS